MLDRGTVRKISTLQGLFQMLLLLNIIEHCETNGKKCLSCDICTVDPTTLVIFSWSCTSMSIVRICLKSYTTNIFESNSLRNGKLACFNVAVKVCCLLSVA